MSQRLDGRVVLITGGTQGVGEAVARACAAAGAAGLCLTGRDAKRGEAVAAEISKTTPTIFVRAELEHEDQVRAVSAAAEKRFGVVDGLVNAAGLTDRGTIEDTSVALWDRLFAVNVRAPFILTQEFVRRLQAKKKPGAIVNVITRSAHGGQPFITAYSASKGALANLTKNTAHSQRRHRIRINGINVGWMDTPGEHAIKLKEGKPEDWLAGAEREQPFGRLVKAADMGVLAVYLLSEASVPMTGALIDYDQNVMGAYD
jgi:NAD(P)-dependent dehydrogenase (short-subunit alcohol dehydrogenase family)